MAIDDETDMKIRELTADFFWAVRQLMEARELRMVCGTPGQVKTYEATTVYRNPAQLQKMTNSPWGSKTGIKAMSSKRRERRPAFTWSMAKKR